ncbi:MAG: hypothetical protein R2819_05970 [Allomuricauda sp.]
MRKDAFPKFAATSFFIFLFLFSCNKEEQPLDLAQDAEGSNVIVEQVDFNAIPGLSKALTDSSGKSILSRSYSGKEDSSFWIDENDVLKLKDSVNNESYSIVIHSDEPSPTKLYNLVVTKRTDGDSIVPFVVEYNFEDGDMSSFAEDDGKHFEGTLNIYALSEFAKITGLNAKDDDPVICFQDVGVRDNTPAENSAPSTPGNPGGGAPSAPSSNPSGPSAIVTRTHISVNNNFRSTGVSVGIGTFYMSRPMMTNEDQDQKAHVTDKTIPNDCPEGWVSVPINENPLDIAAILEELAPDNPIENIAEFLKCYSTSQSAIITIYADQPVANSSASISASGDVGHAFISISQNGKTSTFGFYPSGEGIKSAYGQSIMGNNGGDAYDVSLSRNVSGATLGRILDHAINFPRQYNVYNYNCTDYALEIANIAGMNINNAWGVYPTGQGGDNPGKLGQILRSRSGANKNGGRAPLPNHGCD